MDLRRREVVQVIVIVIVIAGARARPLAGGLIFERAIIIAARGIDEPPGCVMQNREHLGPQEALGAAHAGRLDIIRLDAHKDGQVVAGEQIVDAEDLRPHFLLGALTERLKLRLDALSGAYKHPVALSLNVVDDMSFHARVGATACSEG